MQWDGICELTAELRDARLQIESMQDALRHVHFLMGYPDIPGWIVEEVCDYIDGKLSDADDGST